MSTRYRAHHEHRTAARRRGGRRLHARRRRTRALRRGRSLRSPGAGARGRQLLRQVHDLPGRGGPRGRPARGHRGPPPRSEEHTSELQSHVNLVCRLLLEKKKKKNIQKHTKKNKKHTQK